MDTSEAKRGETVNVPGLPPAAQRTDQTLEAMIRETLARMCLLDDEFMRCAFGGQRALAQDVLRIALDDETLELVEFETQKDLKRLNGARSVELDLWGVDARGHWYNLEVQRGAGTFARRARYHSAALDAEALVAKDPFEHLPEQWVIFVTERDPFGQGKARYQFERTSDDGEPLGDGVRVVYLNGQYRGNDEIGHLMADFSETNPSKIRHPGLRERVEYLKCDPKGVAQMSETMRQLYERGIEQGIEQGIERGIEQGKKGELLRNIRSVTEELHCTVQRAMDILNVPTAERDGYLELLQV